MKFLSTLLSLILSLICLIFGHSYLPATCEEPSKCSLCSATVGESLGHDYSKGVCQRCNKSENEITLQDYKDHCVKKGDYHDGQYGITTYYKGSDYTITVNMVYDPKVDQLRFEHVYDGSTYRFLVLWVEENTPSYKWQFQWIGDTYYIAGEGNVLKNKDLYASLDKISDTMQPSWIKEMNGIKLSEVSKKTFVSAASTDMKSMMSFMDNYFNDNNLPLNMDYFELGK